jgi:DNA primase
MSLSPQWLDELRARTTLSAVIGRSTRLTKAGREFKACCPFHNEKSPSFTVNDEKGFYHCFGCGAHGDVIRWMTDQRGLAFMDAVKELAAQAGMELPEPDPRAAREAEKRDTLHDVMAAAQDWFVSALGSEQGIAARAYLARRGIDARTAQAFGFGFARDEKQALKTALARFPEPMLVEAGLRIAVEDREPYDRFRGRLMLPIQDARGRVIAFGGRILDAGKTDAPKYLNSPDTPLFDKGSTLYNLHRAGPIARKSGRLLVVEGYMDVVALSAAGIGECVAPLGTALTERQLELLWRQVETPALCFDGDAAGQRAAMRAISRALPLLRPAHSLAIVRLPAGLDPDDLVRRDGAGAIERLLDGAQTLLDALWQFECEAQPVPTPEAKAGLKARLLAHVETIADTDIRALYRRELLERFSAFAFPRSPPSADRAPRSRLVDARISRWASQPPRPLPETTRLWQRGEAHQREALLRAVLTGLVRHPSVMCRRIESLVALEVGDSRNRALLNGLLDAAEAGGPLENSALVPILSASGIALPTSQDCGGLAFPFLRDTATPEVAEAALDAAISLLVEGPALQAAIEAATERFDIEEQARLRSRKEELEMRLKAHARDYPREQMREQATLAAKNRQND